MALSLLGATAASGGAPPTRVPDYSKVADSWAGGGNRWVAYKIHAWNTTVAHFILSMNGSAASFVGYALYSDAGVLLEGMTFGSSDDFDGAQEITTLPAVMPGKLVVNPGCCVGGESFERDLWVDGDLTYYILLFAAGNERFAPEPLTSTYFVAGANVTILNETSGTSAYAWGERQLSGPFGYSGAFDNRQAQVYADVFGSAFLRRTLHAENGLFILGATNSPTDGSSLSMVRSQYLTLRGPNLATEICPCKHFEMGPYHLPPGDYTVGLTGLSFATVPVFTTSTWPAYVVAIDAAMPS